MNPPVGGQGCFVSFKQLNLDDVLLRAVHSVGFSEPTDIQNKAIPPVMSGRDLMASAQTGTGKTAAFVLPSLHRLISTRGGSGKGPRVLVLTPTRELAMQIKDDVGQLSRFSKISSGTVVGGMPYPPQLRMLSRPLDILVATPGRLMDHMDQRRVNLSRVEILVLDEADRMLDMGFIDDMKKIASATPPQRQTLLFSATLEGPILKIAQQLLKDPVRVALNTNNDRHKSIQQHINHADSLSHKHELLRHHLGNTDLTQALIFTATKRAAENLSKSLRAQKHKSAALHGDMSQSQRKRTVDSMRDGKFRLLVATDVAARGLDIRGISHVINFDMPHVAEDYIHRIGRTGRAGDTGRAISLVGPGDWDKLARVERLTGRKIERSLVEGLEPETSEPRASRSGSGKPGSGARRKGAKPSQGKRRGSFAGSAPGGDSRPGRRVSRKARPSRNNAGRPRGAIHG